MIAMGGSPEVPLGRAHRGLDGDRPAGGGRAHTRRVEAQRRAASGSYFVSRGRPGPGSPRAGWRGPGKIGAAGRCGRDRGAAGPRPDPLPIKARAWVCRSEPHLRRDLAVPRPPTEIPATDRSRHLRPTTSLARPLAARGARELRARHKPIAGRHFENVASRGQKIRAGVLSWPSREPHHPRASALRSVTKLAGGVSAHSTALVRTQRATREPCGLWSHHAGKRRRLTRRSARAASSSTARPAPDRGPRRIR